MALLARVDSLMRRPPARRGLLWQVAAHGELVRPCAAAQMIRDSVACPVFADGSDVEPMVMGARLGSLSR